MILLGSALIVFQIAAAIGLQYVAVKYLGSNGALIDNLLVGMGSGALLGRAGNDIIMLIKDHREAKEMERRIEELRNGDWT